MIHPRQFITPATVVVGLIATVALIAHPQSKAQSKPAPAAPSVVETKVYLTPTCGCCSKWADHMAAANFKVTREVTTDLESVPARQKVPVQVRSCHTAVVGQYVVEGHVPADLVRQMLKEQPKIVGLTVPNMPMGSPGMEGPNPRSYSILAIKSDGTTYEYARR
jgi:hypothetical protein